MTQEIKNEKLNVFENIEKELLTEMEREKEFNNEELKEEKAKKRNFLLTICEKMLGKFITKLQIKIVVSWNGKELFTYVIPKN